MSRDQPLRVLVVEDEPVALEAHVAYVERLDGFVVAGSARTAQAALQVLQGVPVDVVLLDMNLPDGHGLDVVRSMRAAGHGADIIAVTSARDLDVVRAAVSQGVVQYVLKPFVFATLRDRLTAYRAYRAQLGSEREVGTQAEVDRMLAGLRPPQESTLAKGMSEDVLARVVATLRASAGMSASELAERVVVSRVTARRYAEHLATSGLATRHSRHTGQGRPEVEYRWVG